MVSFVLTVALAAPPVADLETAAAALRRAPAWEVAFTQRYLPAGFTRGTEERGTLLLQPPHGARFEYAGRVFAVNESVARWVDMAGGTCEAMRLSPESVDRLPLAAVLDPGAARATFQVEVEARTLTLIPRRPGGSVAKIVLHLAPDGLPSQIVVHDASGDRNEFHFHRWRRRNALSDNAFAPSLPGLPPCKPEDG
jgi:outer membrane lipoprotein-sorting protein